MNNNDRLFSIEYRLTALENTVKSWSEDRRSARIALATVTAAFIGAVGVVLAAVL